MGYFDLESRGWEYSAETGKWTDPLLGGEYSYDEAVRIQQERDATNED